MNTEEMKIKKKKKLLPLYTKTTTRVDFKEIKVINS